MTCVMAESRDQLAVAAADTVTNLFYTAIFDTCNEIIAAGIGDENIILSCGNTVANKYAGDGVKLRKKPAPRVAKAQVTDAIGAARKIKQKKATTEEVIWIVHPGSNGKFLYAMNVQLANGHPLKDASTHMIVGVVDKETCKELTSADAKVALSLGMKVDYDQIPKDF